MNVTIRRSVFPVIAIAHAMSATSAFPATAYQLVEYKCEVNVIGEHKSSVAAVFRGAGNLQQDLMEIAILRFPSQDISDVRVTDQEGTSVPAAAKTTTGAVLLNLPAGNSQGDSNASESSFTIRYVVQNTSGKIVRIPLPVPQVRPPSGKNSIQLQLALPPGAAHVPDSFPLFSWKDAMRGDAVVTGIPSIVIAHWKDASTIGATDRLVSAATLTNMGMVMLLITGSVIWWFTSGRATGRRNRNPAEAQREN